MAANSRNGRARGSDLPGDVVEDILASQRRRTLLSCLAEADGPVVVDDLAGAVCGAEKRPNRAGDDAAEEVRADIYDRHLPKLTATGIVEYDSMCETVELVDAGLIPALDGT
jgi:hypothetical protein